MARSLYKDEHELFRKTVTAFIDREIAPHYERWEKEGQASREVWKKAGEAGLLLTDIPEDYGGAGADFLYSAVMIEEMAKRVYTAPGFRLHSDIVAPYIFNYGTEEQKRTWLPRMAKGEVITRHRHDRARHRQRPAGDPHHRAAQGQRAGRQRPEDLHHQRRHGRPRHRRRQDRHRRRAPRA